MNEIVSLFNFGSIGLQLFSEENNKLLSSHHSCMCISYRYDFFRRRKLRVGARVREWTQEAQVNLTEATEDPNLISEEPRTSYAQEGKPRSMSFYFKFMQLIIVPIYLCI